MVSKMAAKTIKMDFCPYFSFLDNVATFISPKMLPMYHFEMKFGLTWVLHHCQINMISKMAAKTINWIFAHVLVFNTVIKSP